MLTRQNANLVKYENLINKNKKNGICKVVSYNVKPKKKKRVSIYLCVLSNNESKNIGKQWYINL